jgi:hypothetical protein
MEIAMHKSMITTLALAAAVLTSPIAAQPFPEVPQPQKEHQWLARLVGEWESTAEIFIEPGQPLLDTTGTESTRMIGDYWIVAETKAEFLGLPYDAVLTLGYDPKTKKYVGTWIDGRSSQLWHYKGEVDSSGNMLTLETKGPCPKRPGELANVKEVIEFQDDDTRTFTSSIQEPDGSWTKMMTVNYRRKR